MHIIVKNTYNKCSRACTHFHTHTHTQPSVLVSRSPISEEGILLSNKYKGAMALYWLFPGSIPGYFDISLPEKEPHLWTVLCHNTLSISYSPPYSPVSYSKPNSSHPKLCFTHGSIWVPFPSVGYLVPCFDISLYGHSVCHYLSVEKL